MRHKKGRTKTGAMNEPMGTSGPDKDCSVKVEKKKMHKVKVENHCRLQYLQMQVYSPVKVMKSSVVLLAFLTAVVSSIRVWLVLLFIQGLGISNICHCFQVPFLSLYTNYYFCNRYFVGKNIVLQALRPLDSGMCVSENYGPLFTKRPLALRQKTLASRYWFKCTCQACNEDWPTYDTLSNDDLRLR
jgi:hypothetical protein